MRGPLSDFFLEGTGVVGKDRSWENVVDKPGNRAGRQTLRCFSLPDLVWFELVPKPRSWIVFFSRQVSGVSRGAPWNWRVTTEISWKSDPMPQFRDQSTWIQWAQPDAWCWLPDGEEGGA